MNCSNAHRAVLLASLFCTIFLSGEAKEGEKSRKVTTPHENVTVYQTTGRI